MEFNSSCSAVFWEELTDMFDNIVGKDPEVQKAHKQMEAAICAICNDLKQYGVPSSNLKSLRMFQDDVVNIEALVIKAIISKCPNPVALFFYLGMMFAQFEQKDLL